MMAEHIANSEAITLKNFKQVKHMYMHCGFKVVNILVDGQFECICGNLVDIQIHQNSCYNNENIRKIGPINRKIKERA